LLILISGIFLDICPRHFFRFGYGLCFTHLSFFGFSLLLNLCPDFCNILSLEESRIGKEFVKIKFFFSCQSTFLEFLIEFGERSEIRREVLLIHHVIY
jgi:hypothetical protein